MSEGNASVEVAALKAEIQIDLDKFEEALDQATQMFEDFADGINKALEINLHINDDDLGIVESEIDALKDSLSSIAGGDISENVDSEGSEETTEDLEKIKELEEEISNAGLKVDLTNDDIDTVIQQLEEVKSNLSDIDNTKNIINFSEEDIDNVIAQLQELRQAEEEASQTIDEKVDSEEVVKAKEETDDLKESEEGASKAGNNLGESLGTAIYAFQAVFQAVKGIVESSLEQFAQLQISGEIATRTFGNFGDNLNQFASTSVSALGLTSGETEHYADTLGLALKSQGASNQVAEQMAKSLVGVADNLTLASGGSMTMQQSVQILTSALAGQTYGLKSLGINVAGINKKWTPLHQAMFIMNQVTKDVTSNFGTLGQNMDTTAGEIQKAKSITGQFAESIGEVLAPQLAGLNKHLSSLYKDWDGLSAGIKKGIVIFTEVGVGILAVAAALSVAIKVVEVMKVAFESLAGIMELDPIVIAITAIIGVVVLLYESWKHNWLGMRNVIDSVIKGITPVFDGFIKFMKQEFKSLEPTFKLFEQLWKVLKPVVEDVLKALGTAVVVYTKMLVKEIEIVVKVVTETIKIVTHIINDVIKVVEDMGKAIGSTIKYIENKIKYIENTFKAWQVITDRVIQNIGKFFVNLATDIESGLDDAEKTIEHWGIDVGDFFTKTIPHWMNEIKAWFGTLPEKIEFGLGYALGTLVKWGVGMYDYLTSNVPRWIDDIGHWFEQLPERVGRWLDSTYHRTIAWTGNMLNEAERTGENFLNSVGNWFEQLPGRVGRFLDNTFNSVVSWGSNMISSGESTGSQFLSSVGNEISRLPGEIGGWLSSIIDSVESWGSNMVSTGVSAMERFASGVIGAVWSLPGEMESIGANIVQGLWNGLESEWSGLMAWVHNAASNIVAGFKSALDIHSPSREMYREVGAWILPGISEALNDGMPAMLDDITNKVDVMVSHMSMKLKEGMGNIKVGSPDVNVPWGTPRVVNNDVNTNNPSVGGNGNIQTTGVIGGQTNNFTINESANGSDTANEVIHKLRLAHFGIG